MSQTKLINKSFLVVIITTPRNEIHQIRCFFRLIGNEAGAGEPKFKVQLLKVAPTNIDWEEDCCRLSQLSEIVTFLGDSETVTSLVDSDRI